MEKELYRLHAEMCKAFSNPIRLEILDLIRREELTVSELMKKTGLSQSNLSQQLGILKKVGTVVGQRRGANIYYSIANQKIIKIFELVREILSENIERTHKLNKNTK